MSLEITSVFDEGDPEMEHVLLRASAACVIGHYLLANGGASEDPGGPNRIRQCYWFPSIEIESGDFVSLWTKAGKDTVGEMNDGTPIYRFYWSLTKPVWGDTGNSALLFDLRKWQSFRVH